MSRNQHLKNINLFTPVIKAVRGMRDLVDEEIKRFQWIEEKAKQVFQFYNYQEIRTPLLEESEVFARGVGTSTDIVSKEMYSLLDKNERSLSLRPENTASIVRYMIENQIDRSSKIKKLFYIGPMFRFERPQKGRFRQFYQIGAEYFGVSTPEADLELFLMLKQFLDEIGLQEYRFVINTIGINRDDCRMHYKRLLLDYLQQHQEQLCNDCQNRIVKNPLRSLDCKNVDCKAIVDHAPKIHEHVSDEAKSYFSSLLNLLERFNIRYQIDHRLVRGLDYYSHTVFEIIADNLGAQNAIGGGGRYDELFSMFDYPVVAGTGFALGEDRLSLLVEAKTKQSNKFFVISLDQNSAQKYLYHLRIKGFEAMHDPFYSSFKSQFRQANKFEAAFCLVLGEDEINNQTITIKNMQNAQQISIEQQKIDAFLTNPAAYFSNEE